MNKKQTAVEWLYNELDKYYKMESNFKSKKEILKKAKEMEKQQIMDAFCNGDNSDCISEQNSKEFAEQYYQETFKK